MFGEGVPRGSLAMLFENFLRVRQFPFSLPNLYHIRAIEADGGAAVFFAGLSESFPVNLFRIDLGAISDVVGSERDLMECKLDLPNLNRFCSHSGFELPPFGRLDDVQWEVGDIHDCSLADLNIRTYKHLNMKT